jgi:hypothetical protein
LLHCYIFAASARLCLNTAALIKGRPCRRGEFRVPSAWYGLEAVKRLRCASHVGDNESSSRIAGGDLFMHLSGGATGNSTAGFVLADSPPWQRRRWFRRAVERGVGAQVVRTSKNRSTDGAGSRIGTLHDEEIRVTAWGCFSALQAGPRRSAPPLIADAM